MEILQKFIIFINYILEIKIINNITILDILIYMILITAVTKFIKIGTKGKN